MSRLFDVEDLAEMDHHTDAAGVPVDLVWTGDVWDVVYSGTRIGMLAKAYPSVDEPRTTYVSKLAGDENVAGGYTSPQPEEAIALLIEAARQ
jgi:hypothetical protein